MAIDISAGLLREVVAFERMVSTNEDSGGETGSYTQFLTTRGKLRKKSGGRNFEGSEISLNSYYELIVRYEQALANEIAVSASIRAVVNGKTYTIESIEVYQERFNYYVFRVNEKSN